MTSAERLERAYVKARDRMLACCSYECLSLNVRRETERFIRFSSKYWGRKQQELEIKKAELEKIRRCKTC